MQIIAVQVLPLQWASSVSPAVQNGCEVTLIVLLRISKEQLQRGRFHPLLSVREVLPALAELKRWCFIALGSGRTGALACWQGLAILEGGGIGLLTGSLSSPQMMVHPLKKVEVSIPPASQGQWIDLAFIFLCMAILSGVIILRSSRYWLLDCSLLLTVAAVSLTQGARIVYAVQVPFINGRVLPIWVYPWDLIDVPKTK